LWSWETRVSNYSPILATGGGLLFNGSMDRYLRALDADNGQVLWQTRLPSQAVGGAVTYSVNGRQYVAITAGGGPIAAVAVSMTPEADTLSGSNAVYVFALP
jgi:alcohol dehydrogenase (cytochrome c)